MTSDRSKRQQSHICICFAYDRSRSLSDEEKQKRFAYETVIDPKDEELRKAFASDKKSLKDVVMIGDRNYDIYGASFFEMDSIGVNYGFAFDKNELREAGATHVVETVEELRNLLLS